VCADPANRWVEGSDATGVAYHPDANGAAAVAALVEGALRTHSGRTQDALRNRDTQPGATSPRPARALLHQIEAI
jgi:hypothetical protein